MKSSIAGVVLGMTLSLSPAYGFDPASQATPFDSTVVEFDTAVFIDVLLRHALLPDQASLIEPGTSYNESPSGFEFVEDY